jgi:hypothetical protein
MVNFFAECEKAHYVVPFMSLSDNRYHIEKFPLDVFADYGMLTRHGHISNPNDLTT